jgi:hypothetical protein
MILNIHDQLKYIQNKYIKSGVIMLSTQYRLKLEGICQKIISRETVELEEMIWAEKLAKANRSAATMLRQARRKAENPDMTEDSLDGFLNALDIGGVGHEGKGIRRFESVDDIVDFFRRDENEPDWRNRD